MSFASRNILKGGGGTEGLNQDTTNYYVNEFKKQDRIINFLDSPGVLKTKRKECRKVSKWRRHFRRIEKSLWRNLPHS